MMINVEAHTAFGKEVERRCHSLGLTLNALADRAGLTQNYIGTIENGKKDPSLTTIVSLANGLGVHPGELFGMGGLSPAACEAALLFDLVSQALQEGLLLILRDSADSVRRTAARAAARVLRL
jgi:transcriptional regulator with XRE-family HTH domain